MTYSVMWQAAAMACLPQLGEVLAVGSDNPFDQIEAKQAFKVVADVGCTETSPERVQNGTQYAADFELGALVSSGWTRYPD